MKKQKGELIFKTLRKMKNLSQYNIMTQQKRNHVYNTKSEKQFGSHSPKR